MAFLQSLSQHVKRLDKKLQTIPHWEAWLWLAIALLGLAAILNHSMWRDEVNGWLIARDSPSWNSFWQAVRYEGHPVLWYLCLWFLNQITPNPVAMQVFHWGLALTAIAIFLRYSPFSRLQKTLFVLGYLPFYEYLVISRNYALGVLALWGVCAYFPYRNRSYLPLAVGLGILANSNAYGLLLSVSLTMIFGLEAIQNGINKEKNLPHSGDITLSLAIILGAITLSVFTLLPPGDSTLQGGADQWFFHWEWHRFNQALSRIWNSYILILVPADARPLDVSLFAGLSGLLLLIWGVYFSDYPLVLGFYALASGLVLTFTYLKFLGSARHYGHLYLILITAYWLKAYFPLVPLITPVSPRPWPKLHRWSHRWAPVLLNIFLICQLIAGLVGYIRVVTLPYSASRAVATYLQSQGLDQGMLIGSEDFAVSPISGYLNRPIYYPEIQALGSFVLFTQKRQPLDNSSILDQIAPKISTFSPPITLILNRPLEADHPALVITPLPEFRRSFIGNEQYFLYGVKSATPNPASEKVFEK